MALSLPAPEPLTSEDDLYEVFRSAEKPRAAWRVGTEAEKFGVVEATYAPLTYEGAHSVTRLFAELVGRHGWREEREYEGGPVIALSRGASSITLEPGCQFELSGAPAVTIHETCREFRDHMRELGAISEELGIMWLGLGFHPFATQDELPWVPKLRYGVMREYLPTRGTMALDMMRRTSTVQANLDYSSEADAMRKMRAALRISPVVTAMFANAPFVEGRASGEVSRRARVWLHMDPDRTGLLPFLWSDRAGYRDYVEWALDAPMFLVKRDARVLHNTGQTFRDFLRHGFEGVTATRGDWESHLGTLFPEVRLKRTIELRGADSQGTPLICALPALWKGLLYDDRALAGLEELTRAVTLKHATEVRAAIPVEGLRARWLDRPLADWANEVVDLAMAGLARIGAKNDRGEDESVHLRRLADLVRAGHSPADVLLANVAGARDFRAAVVEHAQA